MVQLVLAFLTDIVFESTASAQRAFRGEMDRYLDDRGMLQRAVPRPVPTR